MDNTTRTLLWGKIPTGPREATDLERLAEALKRIQPTRYRARIALRVWAQSGIERALQTVAEWEGGQA